MEKNDFRKNMLLKKEDGTDIVYRVLEIAEKILVIDCVKRTMPVWKTYEELKGYTETVEDNGDSFEQLDSDAKKTAYQRYHMISGILPFLSSQSMRTTAIQQMAETHGITKQTVRKYLCDYLATMKMESLAPRQRNTDRPLTPDEKIIRKSLNKWYYTTKKRTLKNVYTLMLQNYYCDAEGKLLEEYPSYYQFRYFFRKYNKKTTQYISRNGLSYYQRNQRPLVGDGVQAFAPHVGVGMLDSTILDIYLVNQSGGIVGRPVLTACVDAYSGLCCGYSLSWEGGIYSLRDLLLNVIADKKEHCRKFGIEINQQDWNCNMLPMKLVTDMGSEYKSMNFEQITDLGVQIINLPSYRPELKSKVEKFFDCIQGYYRNQLKGKGVVEPDFQERGAHDYRKDACLTMEEFEKIIVYCIVYYNSKRILEHFPYSEEMLDAEIKPHANKIWNYGCSQMGCGLMKVSKETLILTLLPRTTGKFTRHGLSANGMHYHNQNYREQYLDGKECMVAYNPDDVCQIWLLENGAYIPFDLIESRFREKDLTGVQRMKQKQRELVRQETAEKIQAEIDLAGHIQIIADMTENRGTPSIKDIRKNRKKEQKKTHKDFVKGVVVNE